MRSEAGERETVGFRRRCGLSYVLLSERLWEKADGDVAQVRKGWRARREGRQASRPE